MGWVVWLGIFKDILFISFIIHIIDFFLFSPAGHFPTLVRSAPGRGTYLPPLWGRWEDEVYLLSHMDDLSKFYYRPSSPRPYGENIMPQSKIHVIPIAKFWIDLQLTFIASCRIAG